MTDRDDEEAPLDDHAAEPRSDSGAACREPLTARGQARAGLTPLVMVGYGHASLIDCLLPVVARPSRAAKRASRVVTELTATPCDCAADHVEVWVRRDALESVTKCPTCGGVGPDQPLADGEGGMDMLCGDDWHDLSPNGSQGRTMASTDNRPLSGDRVKAVT